MPPRAVDAVGHVYRPLDDERIIVEGRDLEADAPETA